MSTIQPPRTSLCRKQDNKDVDAGLAKVQTDDNTFLRTRSVTRLSDWPLSDGRVRERDGRPEEVFARDYDRLVQALTIVAGDKETAADAVQEAFVCLVRRWDHLSTYEDPAGWVRRVALNQIRDHQRSVWRQAKLLLRIEQQPPAPEGASPMAEQVWEQLRILPLKQRTALALYYVADLTEREVAAVMRVSEGTVKQHLHRARQTLRETLEA
jgi:RNA polymerase sigma-70 factor (ECF subfamily)